MAKQPNRTAPLPKGKAGKAGKGKPITSHQLFPAVVALWFGALFGLGSLAVRPTLLETLVMKSRLDLVVPAAAPPLGITARILIALIMAALGSVIGVLIARRIGRPKVEVRQRKRGAKSSEEATRASYFGQAEPDSLFEEAASSGGVLAGRRRGSLAFEHDEVDFVPHEMAPLPGGAPQVLDISGIELAEHEPAHAEFVAEHGAEAAPLDLGAFAQPEPAPASLFGAAPVQVFQPTVAEPAAAQSPYDHTPQSYLPAEPTPAQRQIFGMPVENDHVDQSFVRDAGFKTSVFETEEAEPLFPDRQSPVAAESVAEPAPFAAPAAQPTAAPAPAEPKAAKPIVLGRIEFQGLQRCDQATAAKAVALKAGVPFDQGQLDAAAKRLAETGYFAELNYSFASQDGQANVLFKTVEAKWDARCLFDNFIWFTQPEIYAAIRQHIPWFDGTAPDNVHIVNRLTAILDQLLQQRGIPRKTNYLIVTGNIEDEKARRDHLFLAAGAPLPVCSVRFPGATPALEKQLQSSAKTLLNTDYAYSQVTEFIQTTFLPLYRQKGYVRAVFAEASAQPDNGANKKCSGGVNISVPVAEGGVYKLGKFDWAGNQAIGSATLQDLLGMKKTAVVADGAKIDKGLAAIKEEYGEKGYLDVKIAVQTDFDESAKLANYQITVNEGLPYRVGEVVIANASEAEQKRIRSKWQLASGAVFNLTAVKEFIKKTFDDRSPRRPRLQLRKDAAKQVADLLITY